MKYVSTLYIFSVLLAVSLQAQSGSRVELHTFYSAALDRTKTYNIYLPAGYDESTTRYPVVYFLRLHEAEWFDPGLSGRNGTALKEVADTLFAGGHAEPMILVGPSTGSNYGTVAGLFNMLRPDLTDVTGVGTGRFEDYFIEDLIPHIDATYRTIPDWAHRGVDGFSFGGYTSLALSMRNPGVFSSVGSYDGTMMFYRLDDPDIPGSGPDDPFWLSDQYDAHVGPLFDIPRNVDYMLEHSAVDILLNADPALLDSLRAIQFHITTGYSDVVANMRRNIQLVDSLAAKGIFNTFPDIVLAPDAVHDYGFADVHASQSLIKHGETFEQATSVRHESEIIPVAAALLPNYPNPFATRTAITFTLPRATPVQLVVYDLMGREVARLVEGFKGAGTHTVSFEAGSLPSGHYVYRLETETTETVNYMVLLR